MASENVHVHPVMRSFLPPIAPHLPPSPALARLHAAIDAMDEAAADLRRTDDKQNSEVSA